jgi:SNF2 family DNA or RNA helicase
MNRSDYKFPGVPKPFAHQVKTWEYILDHDRCFVFNDIGTGKTWSGVWAIDYLMYTKEVFDVVIVAPLSTLEIVWKRTFFHLDSTLDVTILKGTAEKRINLLKRTVGLSRGRISIINPDALHIIADAVENCDLLLVDESATFRNPKSRRLKALNKIAKKAKRAVFMTGSPCPEAPTDIWATARIICPDRVPVYFGQFRDMVMKKISQYQWVALRDAQNTVSLMLKDCQIRFTRDECIDLPPSHHAEVEVAATSEQAKMIKTMRKEACVMLENGDITAANEAVVISKILQIASGAVKFKDEEGNDCVLDTDCTPKFDALEEILEASTQPVIVYAPYKAVIKKIASWLYDKKYTYAGVTGDTSPDGRLAAFDQVQSGLIRVLVAHPQAMAHGITLTNANIVVWWTPVYSHEIYEQANGRVVRPGQTRSTYFVHLMCSALEARVLGKLESKAKLQGTLLDYLQREES